MEIRKFFSNKGTLNEVRMRVIEEFSKEKKGNGNKDKASRYTYYVETFENENHIFLKRPALFHNGFDFLICTEKYEYRNYGKIKNSPRHKDLINDLKKKKEINSNMYNLLYDDIQQIFECKKDCEEINIKNVVFNDNGLSIEHILKLLKWFFIEQDIRYWNYSGRNMLFENIPNKY